MRTTSDRPEVAGKRRASDIGDRRLNCPLLPAMQHGACYALSTRRWASLIDWSRSAPFCPTQRRMNGDSAPQRAIFFTECGSLVAARESPLLAPRLLVVAASAVIVPVMIVPAVVMAIIVMIVPRSDRLVTVAMRFVE